ncbi:hypothetical protein EFL26_03455 [Nocardioides pocheonensis]|uniref:Uncharacterized protein n=1 Tax=Nocardioides pocheonensis TaxID=661485 RepID=A0A3N0GVX1_9ACTN|nr:hypothetical protein EFL26_03455 [Nocardioides pocheonensis]
MHVRPFIERWPHSPSEDAGGASGRAASVFSARTAGLVADLAAVVPVVDAAALSLYRASRIARIAASLLIAHSPGEL